MKTKYFGLASAFFCVSLMSFTVSSAHDSNRLNNSQLVTLANADRSAQHVQMLTENPKLDLAAELKIDDMISHKYFSHTSPQGLTAWYFINKADYSYKVAGENLALNFSEPDKAEQAWMSSPEHKSNILNPKFTEIGIAQKEIILRGQRTNAIVELFGAEATEIAAR